MNLDDSLIFLTIDLYNNHDFSNKHIKKHFKYFSLLFISILSHINAFLYLPFKATHFY